MRKKITLSLFFLFFMAIGHLGLASYQEEGPYLDVEETGDNNFFMLDVEEMELSLEGDLPNMLPCDGKVTSEYGWRRYSRRGHRSRLHKGLDIAAPVGTPILAPAPGRVAFVGRRGGYGQTVVIDHGGSVQTLFAHNSKIMVKEGDTVKRGQWISAVGSSGRSSGPHLHYEVRVEGVPVNPSRFF